MIERFTSKIAFSIAFLGVVRLSQAFTRIFKISEIIKNMIRFYNYFNVFTIFLCFSCYNMFFVFLDLLLDLKVNRSANHLF